MTKGMITSIIFNVILLAGVIALFFGKGVKIENHSHTHQHQEQFQGQLMMNFMMYKGNKIEWKTKQCNSLEEILSFLTTLPPQESYFAKLVHPGHHVIYPVFFKKENK